MLAQLPPFPPPPSSPLSPFRPLSDLRANLSSPPFRPGSKSTFFATLRLPPGTHPLRFIVDDHFRCTDTLPTATDVDGTFINYIEIPSPSHSPSQSRSMPANGWEAGGAVSVLAGGPSAQGTSSSSKQFPEMEWTEQIPPRLFQLAAAEEQYLAARAAAAQNPPSGRHGSQYPSLPPPPPVPYPPSLPRHLEKVILNSSSSRNPNAASFTPAILASHESARPRIIGTGTTGPLIPASGPRPRAKGVPGVPGVPNGLTLGPMAGGQIQAGVPASGGILISGTGGGEGAGDDNSVLPVPNHVVLNHLGTSAIKNGVLAVGTTTRYHRKVSFPLSLSASCKRSKLTMFLRAFPLAIHFTFSTSPPFTTSQYESFLRANPLVCCISG